MTLKSVDDNGFDDELAFMEIAYLAKNFRNFLRNNNRRARSKNNAEPKNPKKNEPTKINNTKKSKEKVGQSSSKSLGQQCFGCQEYGHMKLECLTFLRTMGKTTAVTLSDGEISDHQSRSDKDGNFFAFTATVVVNESDSVEENLFDGELSKSADLQEAYNKLCKVAAKDAMSVDLGLKKIAILEQEKKNLLLNVFDAIELVNKVNAENIKLVEKIKNLELELFVVREQSNRSASSKLDHILSIQKSSLEKSGLGFVDSIFESETHSTNFVHSSKPSKIEFVKPKEEVPAPRKIRVDFKESKPKVLTYLRVRSMIDLCKFVIFVESLAYLPNLFQVASC